MTQQKNIGDQIKDAVSDAIATQDFSSMKSVVEEGINAAAASISVGLERAQQQASVNRAEYLKRQGEHFQELAQKRQEMLAIQSRYGSVSSSKAGAYIMAIGGGVLGGAFGIGAIVNIMEVVLGVSALSAGTIALPLLCAAGVALCAIGTKRAGFIGRFETYKRILGKRAYCALQDLSVQTGRPLPGIVADLQKMIAKGFFREGHLDARNTTLMVTNEAYRLYSDSEKAAEERRRQEQLINSVGTQKNAPLSSEARAMLERGQAYLSKIHKSNDDIPGEVVSEKIAQIELVLQTIFERAQEHPEVIPDLEQLMNYYLPVTVKLLDAYEDLDSQPIQSETIEASKKEIEETLDTLNTAFTKLLDSIFRDTAWDVSTDITVLHTVLAQEGLVDDPFDK